MTYAGEKELDIIMLFSDLTIENMSRALTQESTLVAKYDIVKALIAAKRNKEKLDMTDFEDSKDKVYMGLERKSKVISEEDRKTTAYHEGGHALVGFLGMTLHDPQGGAADAAADAASDAAAWRPVSVNR